MTREELIINLKYTMEKHKKHNVNTTNVSLMCKDILDYLEQTRWIPVSERLPKAGEYIGAGEHIGNVARYYLVQNEYGDMLVARYTRGKYWEQIYQLEPIDDEIVAWMPLPEPYEPQEREE